MKHESKKRSLTKAIIWRVIGVIWTWIGAYFIILLFPENLQKPTIIASAIVIFHHTTRMVMYYFYERIWNRVKWGNA